MRQTHIYDSNHWCNLVNIYIFMAQQPLGFLIFEAARSHSGTPHSVGLLWTSDRSVAETSDNTQHSQETDIHARSGIRTRNPRMQSGLRPRSHRDRLANNTAVGWGGGWGWESTKNIRNLNLRKSQVRKTGKILELSFSFVFTPPMWSFRTVFLNHCEAVAR